MRYWWFRQRVRVLYWCWWVLRLPDGKYIMRRVDE